MKIGGHRATSGKNKEEVGIGHNKRNSPPTRTPVPNEWIYVCIYVTCVLLATNHRDFFDRLQLGPNSGHIYEQYLVVLLVLNWSKHRHQHGAACRRANNSTVGRMTESLTKAGIRDGVAP